MALIGLDWRIRLRDFKYSLFAISVGWNTLNGRNESLRPEDCLDRAEDALGWRHCWRLAMRSCRPGRERGLGAGGVIEFRPG